MAPWRASDGAVRKKRPLSSMVDRAGEVADGEIITMPLGLATFSSIAMGDARAVPADDGVHLVRGHDALGRGRTGGGVAAGGIGAYGHDLRAAQQGAAVTHFLHRQLGALRHVGSQRLDGGRCSRIPRPASRQPPRQCFPAWKPAQKRIPMISFFMAMSSRIDLPFDMPTVDQTLPDNAAPLQHRGTIASTAQGASCFTPLRAAIL